MTGTFAKKALSVISALWFSFSVFAVNDQPAGLVIWLKSGEKIQVKLSDTLKTTFSNGNLVIGSDSAVFQWPLESVVKYTYDLPPSSVETPTAVTDIKVSYLNDILTIETASPNISVKMWGVDGSLIRLWNFEAESKISMSLAGYAAGIYVMEINGFTHKIIKR